MGLNGHKSKIRTINVKFKIRTIPNKRVIYPLISAIGKYSDH